MQRKFLSSASLGMLLILFGAGFIQFVPQVSAQATAATDESCILIGTDTENTITENGDSAEVDDENEAAEDSNVQNEVDDDNEGADSENVQDEVDANDENGENESADQNEEDTEQSATEDDTQDASYTGSITVDEAALDGMSASEQCTALMDQATITAEEAQAIAEAEGTVVAVSLDVENGFLVYGVQLDDGRDVKIDAGTGEVLNIDAADSDANEAENESANGADTTSATSEQNEND